MFLRRLVDEADFILDVGTSSRFAKELRPYENWFEGKRYIAAGFEPSLEYGRYNCDRHEDVEAMSFESGALDAVICLEVLEHVRHPWVAAAELLRVLRPGGHLLVSVPFLFPFHGKSGRSARHDEYPDFWRFTHQGLDELFRDLREREIRSVDGPLEMRLRFLRLDPLLYRWPLRNIVDLIDRPALGNSATRLIMLGRK